MMIGSTSHQGGWFCSNQPKLNQQPAWAGYLEPVCIEGLETWGISLDMSQRFGTSHTR